MVLHASGYESWQGPLRRGQAHRLAVFGADTEGGAEIRLVLRRAPP